MKFTWGTGLLVFILLFVTLCVTFIIFALQQNLNLVSDDYYKKGVEFDKERRMENRSLQYVDSVRVVNTESGIMVVFPNRFIKRVTEPKLLIYRPSDNRRDVFVEVVKDTVIVPAEKLILGRYIVKISWIMNSEPYIVEKDISVK